MIRYNTHFLQCKVITPLIYIDPERNYEQIKKVIMKQAVINNLELVPIGK